MTNAEMFLQINRDVGTLIAMLGDAKLSASDRDTLNGIAQRFDDCADQLQKALYPESEDGK